MNRAKGINLFLTIAMLVASSVSMGGHVICVGFDGHVAIEAAGWQGFCAEDEVAPRSPLAISASAHCGTCIDYEIDIDRAPKVAGSSLVPVVPMQVDVSLIFAFFLPRRLSVAASTPGIPPSHLAQNVVLII